MVVGVTGIEPVLSALQAGDVDHVVHTPSFRSEGFFSPSLEQPYLGQIPSYSRREVGDRAEHSILNRR